MAGQLSDEAPWSMEISIGLAIPCLLHLKERYMYNYNIQYNIHVHDNNPRKTKSSTHEQKNLQFHCPHY